MFRPSFVGGLGYCGLDRRRAPLTGAEQRACWTGQPEASADGFFGVLPAAPMERGLMEVKPADARSGPPISGR